MRPCDDVPFLAAAQNMEVLGEATHTVNAQATGLKGAKKRKVSFSAGAPAAVSVGDDEVDERFSDSENDDELDNIGENEGSASGVASAAGDGVGSSVSGAPATGRKSSNDRNSKKQVCTRGAPRRDRLLSCVFSLVGCRAASVQPHSTLHHLILYRFLVSAGP